VTGGEEDGFGEQIERVVIRLRIVVVQGLSVVVVL